MLRKIGEMYDRFNEKLRLSIIFGWLEKKRPLHFNSNIEDYSIEGRIPKGMVFIFSTNTKGVILCIENQLYSLLGQVSGYGITISDNYIYVFVKTGMHGHIARFQLNSNLIVNYQVVVWGLSRGVHQIDIIDKSLCVVDTYNNRIIKIDNYDNIVNKYWKCVSEEYFPNGKLKYGRKSMNYNHFNSIYSFHDNIYIVAHNETYKTNRNSELYTLGKHFNLINKKKISGSNCHNFYKGINCEIFCASLEGLVIKNRNSILFGGGGFTRGVSISDDGYLVGVSPVQTVRNNRTKGISKVIFLKHNSNRIVFELIISNTQILEIRRIDVTDYSISNSNPYKCE